MSYVIQAGLAIALVITTAALVITVQYLIAVLTGKFTQRGWNE